MSDGRIWRRSGLQQSSLKSVFYIDSGRLDISNLRILGDVSGYWKIRINVFLTMSARNPWDSSLDIPVWAVFMQHQHLNNHIPTALSTAMCHGLGIVMG